MDINAQPTLKYKSKTDARGRIIYFLSGTAYFVMALSMIYIIYKIVSGDKDAEFAAACDGAVTAENAAKTAVAAANRRAGSVAEASRQTHIKTAEMVSDKAAKGAVAEAHRRSEAVRVASQRQSGGGPCRLPFVLYAGVIAVALGLVWTTLTIHKGKVEEAL
jgi:hypothetical protein